MIRIGYDVIVSKGFQDGMKKLLAYPGFKNFSVAFNAGKISQEVDIHTMGLKKSIHALAKEFAILDEKGEIKTPEGAPEGAFQVPNEKIEEWEAKVAELQARELVVDRPKFKAEDLSDVGLTPVEILALEGLIEITSPQDLSPAS